MCNSHKDFSNRCPEMKRVVIPHLPHFTSPSFSIQFLLSLSSTPVADPVRFPPHLSRLEGRTWTDAMVIQFSREEENQSGSTVLRLGLGRCWQLPAGGVVPKAGQAYLPLNSLIK